MASTWFAHRLPDRPESAWEPLARHLDRVARGTASRAAKFGAGDLGEAAGRLHDLGKYAPDFLAYLRGERDGIAPEDAGAAYARGMPGLGGRLLARVLAAQRVGLADAPFEDEGFQDRDRAELAPIVAAARADGALLPRTLTTPNFVLAESRDGFRLSFFIRMLLSCLVDADREDRRAFDAQARSEGEAREPAPGLAELDRTAREWSTKRTARLAREGAFLNPVARFRALVREEVLAEAGNDPGVFTLTVPTGGGKTLTALAFALAHGAQHAMDRVISVAPCTGASEPIARIYRETLGSHAGSVFEHHVTFDATQAPRSETREAPRLVMEAWDEPIIVTTAIPFFASLFSDRPARCRRLHNLARSVILLDETQMIPLPALGPCIAALRELAENYGSSIVLCSAAEPALEERPHELQRSFAGGFRGVSELAPEPPALFAAFRRVAVREGGPLDDGALVQRLATAEQALCIVNSRGHARELFRLAQGLPGAVHLSSAMHAAHRSRVLARIRADLAARRPCRLITTALVEATTDLDFPLVLRAEAGLDSIVEAAGRCNRDGQRRASESEVVVFRAPGHPPPPELRPNAEAGMEALRLHRSEPLAPAALEDYFRALYWHGKSGAFDHPGILARCEGAAQTLAFPFTAMAAIGLTQEARVPLIVAAEDEGNVASLVRRLQATQFPEDVAGGLQRFAVAVSRSVRALLIARGLATPIRSGLFADQFVTLADLALYRPDVGLDWDDPLFIAAERAAA